MTIKIALFVVAVIFIIQMVLWESNAAPADDLLQIDPESKAKIDKAVADMSKVLENLAKDFKDNPIVQNITKLVQEQTSKFSNTVNN